MFRRPTLVLFALGALTALLVPVRAVRAEDGAEPVDLATAMQDLSRFKQSLGSRKSINPQINADMEAVAADYHNLAKPKEPALQEVPADATKEQQAEIEKANEQKKRDYEDELKTFKRESEGFRKKTEGYLIDAMVLAHQRTRDGPNLRDDVNIKAAELLGQLPDPKIDPDEMKSIRERVSKDMIRMLQLKTFKAKYTVPQAFLDAAFAALAKLGDMNSLEWMIKEFSNSKTKSEEVDRLTAAHKAMILFDVPKVPGKLRYELVKDFVTTYSGTETQAAQNTSDPGVQAAKHFWDRIKNDAIRVVQVYTGEPKKEDGTAISTMGEFFAWFHKGNDSPRRPPWTPWVSENR